MDYKPTFGDIHAAIIEEARSNPKPARDYTHQEFKKTIADIKDGGCAICGYKRCKAALQFHHKDPSKKLFGLSKPPPSRKLFTDELAKCVLLCANCHCEVHANVTPCP